ncbi:MAG: hypothetical protein ACRDM7_03750 [Thermoleophilaceae bacterium]
MQGDERLEVPSLNATAIMAWISSGLSAGNCDRFAGSLSTSMCISAGGAANPRIAPGAGSNAVKRLGPPPLRADRLRAIRVSVDEGDLA